MNWEKVVEKLAERDDGTGLLLICDLRSALQAGLGPNRNPRPVMYSHDEKGSIVLPPGAPFDGNDVLIELAEGWVQARWENGRSYDTLDGTETTGFCWVTLDDSYQQKDLDNAKRWMPVPERA